MSAETLGGSFLAEIKEEGLDELLHSLQYLPPSSHPPPTAVPQLDRLLQIFQTGQQYQQFHIRRTIPNSQQHDSVRELPLPVLELTSTSACAGKTQLLYQIITLALLPATIATTTTTTPLHGKSAAVVLLDLSNKISILRLRDVIAAHIASCLALSASPTLSQPELTALIRDSLLHLHIFHPQTSASLLATLASLPNYFLVQPFAHFSAGRPIGAIILSDLTAFYWQDRLRDTEIPEQSSEPLPVGMKPSIQTYHALISALRSLQHTFSCPVIATTFSFATPSSIENHHVLRPSTPAAWNSFVTIQLVIERVFVPKFPLGISAQEAEVERAMRQGVVERGEQRGWVNWWMSGVWREEVKEAVRVWENDFGGWLTFWIREGIIFAGVEEGVVD